MAIIKKNWTFIKEKQKMKLIPWHIHDDVEAYTTTKELGDISLNIQISFKYYKTDRNLLLY